MAEWVLNTRLSQRPTPGGFYSMGRKITVDHQVDKEKLKQQAAAAAAALSERGSRAAHQAGALAGQAREQAIHAKDWAGPKVDDLRHWAQPRAEKAWRDGLQAAAPRVQQAAAKAAPLIDSAHHKIVDDLLPRAVAAANSAAAHAADAQRSAAAAAAPPLTGRAARAAKKAAAAAEKASAAAASAAAKQAAKEARSGSGAKRWVWAAVGVGAVAAGYVFWKRAQPQTDPWAEPWEQNPTADYSAAGRHGSNSAAGTVGSAVSKGREVAGVAAKQASAAAGKATTAARSAAGKATSAARAGAHKVSEAAPWTHTGAGSTNGATNTSAPDPVDATPAADAATDTPLVATPQSAESPATTSDAPADSPDSYAFDDLTGSENTSSSDKSA